MEIKINEQTLVEQEDIEISDYNKQIAKELFVFASSIDIAVGMAAPQVGINKRICVVNYEQYKIAAINPHITGVEGPEMIESSETCLSWPGRTISASRYPKIRVKYYDVFKEKECEEIFESFTSIIWQHELDHLDGVQENVVARDYRTVKDVQKIGRNDPCPCGSGKKYKKCCLK